MLLTSSAIGMIRAAAAGALLFLGGTGCCVHSLARSMIYPGSPTALPAESSGRLRIVDYEAADGQKLRGALCLAGSAGRPVIVYFHGNGESAGDNLGFASEITSLGWDLFLAEYRGYGGLAGSPT